MPSPVQTLPWPTLGGKQLWGDVFAYAGYRIQQNVYTRHHRLLSPQDIRLASGDYALCHETFLRLKVQRQIRPRSDHLVLLIHGIFRSKDSFGPMTRALRSTGYEAQAVNYPSTRQTIQQHAEQVETLLERLEDVRTVSFVTHSMGGLVARMVLGGERRPWRDRIAVNRLVMIATPNRGAEIATRLKQHLPSFFTIAGPSLDEINQREFPRPDVPFGIVAGARGDGRGYNPLLTGDNDMTVTLESTWLDGAEDFLIVPAVHTFIMIDPRVVAATLRYLQLGRFED